MGLDRKYAKGFSLIELMITVSVLAILTLGVIPLVQVSVKRQKEQQLRETLRLMREAIDQFHREALAAPVGQPATGSGTGTTDPKTVDSRSGSGTGAVDPRIRVYISDQTLFTVDNPDRYPPTLETLTSGVSVMPLATQAALMGGVGLHGEKGITDYNQSVTTKTKVYLRQIPIDPMTGKADWDFRSCYDAVDATSWGGENVFDVHSKSKDKALNGEKYSDW